MTESRMVLTYLEIVAPLWNKLGIDVPRLYIGAPALELFTVERPVGIEVIAAALPVEPVPRVQRKGAVAVAAAVPLPI